MKIFQFFRKSIQSKFISLTLPVLILLILVLGIFLYRENREIHEKNIHDLSVQIVRSKSEEVSKWLESMILELTQVAHRTELKSGKWNQIKPVLESLSNERDTTYGLVFFAQQDGTYFISGRGKANANVSDRVYFKDVVKEGKQYSISNPSVSRSTGLKKFNVSVPVTNEKNEVIGCLAVNVNLNTFSQIIGQIKIGKSGYGYILDNTGMLIAHPNEDYVMSLNINESADSGFVNLQESAKKILKRNNGNVSIVTPQGTEELLIFSKIHKYSPGWILGVAIPTDEIYADIDTMLMEILSLLVIFVLIFSVVILFLTRNIVTVPLRKLIGFTEKISDGYLNQQIENNNIDEVGQMFNALSSMQDNLREIVEIIQDEAASIEVGSKQISDTSETLATGANQQSASTEQISSSMEEMVASINQNTENAIQTENVALESAKRIVDVADSSEKSLESIKEILDKIKIIGDIAERTDLLAVNAAIEAARAGEKGKGFAVVAGEVRKLAEESQKSATEIDDFSSYSEKITQQARDLMIEIAPKIQKNATFIREIAAASKEQNVGSEQIKEAILQLTNISQQNSAASEELAASAENLTGQANNLVKAISFFKFGNNTTQEKINELSLKAAEILRTIDELKQGSSTEEPVKNKKETPEEKKLEKADASVVGGVTIDLEQENNNDSNFEAYK